MEILKNKLKQKNFLKKKSIIFEVKKLYNNNYVLKSLDFGYLSESEVISVTKLILKNLKIYLKLETIEFYNRLSMKNFLVFKSKLIRMGGGKSKNIRKFIYVVRPGQVLFEIKLIKKNLKLNLIINQLLNLIRKRISISTKIFLNKI